MGNRIDVSIADSGHHKDHTPESVKIEFKSYRTDTIKICYRLLEVPHSNPKNYYRHKVTNSEEFNWLVSHIAFDCKL